MSRSFDRLRDGVVTIRVVESVSDYDTACEPGDCFVIENGTPTPPLWSVDDDGSLKMIEWHYQPSGDYFKTTPGIYGDLYAALKLQPTIVNKEVTNDCIE